MDTSCHDHLAIRYHFGYLPVVALDQEFWCSSNDNDGFLLRDKAIACGIR